jgi:hypothetical protein
VAALAVDGQFVPALLLIRSLRFIRPQVFQQGDITIDEAMKRSKGASTEAKEHGKGFVESLASSSTSGSRLFLTAYWKYWIDRNYPEAVRWYRMAAAQGNAMAQNNLGWCL